MQTTLDLNDNLPAQAKAQTTLRRGPGLSLESRWHLYNFKIQF